MSGSCPVNGVRRRLALGVNWSPKLRQRFSTSDVCLSKPPRPALARKPRRKLPTTVGRSPINDSQSRAPSRARTPIPRTVPRTEDVWPTKTLEDANRLGLIEMTAEKAVEFLHAFKRRHPLLPEQVFKNHDLQPSDVTLLARVLLRTSHTKVARDMLLAAARLNDEAAILLVVKEALRTDNFGATGVELVYKRCFKSLVERSHPAACLLEGQIYEHQGKKEKALDLFEKLVARKVNESIDDEIDFGTVWIAISRMKARKGDRAGVEEAINTAALQYDNPAAYYQLAKLFTKPSSTEYETYLLKAAASGEIKAAHELGVLYFGQSQGRISFDDEIHQDRQETEFEENAKEGAPKNDEQLAVILSAATEKRSTARQWFELAADAGLTGSQVYLAALLRVLGEVKEGWQCLEAASKSKESLTWVKAIEFLREHWESAHFDFSQMNMESLRKGYTTANGLAA